MSPLLVVDGYNVIGAWPEAERRGWDMNESRDQLARLLEDYGGYTGEEIVLVFDGYQSDRRTASVEERKGLTIVFTPHGETADSYIERLVAQTPKYRVVRVATSDGLEQSQVLSTGGIRMTSRELLRELHQSRSRGLDMHRNAGPVQRQTLSGRLSGETLETLERLRRGDTDGHEGDR